MKLWIATTVAMALGGSLSAQVPLAGRRTAPPFEIALSSEFHRSLYGPAA